MFEAERMKRVEYEEALQLSQTETEILKRQKNSLVPYFSLLLLALIINFTIDLIINFITQMEQLEDLKTSLSKEQNEIYSNLEEQLQLLKIEHAKSLAIRSELESELITTKVISMNHRKPNFEEEQELYETKPW